MFVFGHQLWLANSKLAEIRQEQINRTRRVYDVDHMRERTSSLEKSLADIIRRQGEITARQQQILNAIESVDEEIGDESDEGTDKGE